MARLSSAERRERLLKQAYATPADAAFLIRRDKSTLTRWIARGLPTYIYEEGGQRFVKLSEVHEWVMDPTKKTRIRAPKLMHH